MRVPSGKLLLPNSLDEEMNALDVFQPLFHFSRVGRDGCGQHHRMEFPALYAGGLEQPPVLFTEAVDFSLNHAADRRRDVAADLVYRLRQNPAALVLNNDFPVPEVPHQVHHEQRISLRALPQELRKGRGEAVLGKLQRQITRHISFTQVLQA